MNEDITERKHMDNTLRETEERFRGELKDSPVVLFNQDLELRYTWINSPVLAWAERGYIGRTDSEILGAREGDQLIAIKRAVLESGVGSRTSPIVTFNGEKHYYDLTVEPMKDSSGAIQGVMCAAMDITRMKRAAAERDRLIEELEEAQRELLKRNLELEVLHNEETRWLGMATHDLRNPLSGILGICELLIEDAAIFSEEHRELHKSIYSSSRLMLELLNDGRQKRGPLGMSINSADFGTSGKAKKKRVSRRQTGGTRPLWFDRPAAIGYPGEPERLGTFGYLDSKPSI
jgi:signal transduction histidine kinase